MSTDIDITNIIRDMVDHFYDMPAAQARRASILLSTHLRAVMDDIVAGRSPAALHTDVEREAELYSKLNALFVAPLRAGVSPRVTRDLRAGLWAVGRVLSDICWVTKYNGKKTYGEVVYERLDDHTVSGPISRLIYLWESPDLRE